MCLQCHDHVNTAGAACDADDERNRTVNTTVEFYLLQQNILAEHACSGLVHLRGITALLYVTFCLQGMASGVLHLSRATSAFATPVLTLFCTPPVAWPFSCIRQLTIALEIVELMLQHVCSRLLSWAYMSASMFEMVHVIVPVSCGNAASSSLQSGQITSHGERKVAC